MLEEEKEEEERGGGGVKGTVRKTKEGDALDHDLIKGRGQRKREREMIAHNDIL